MKFLIAVLAAVFTVWGPALAQTPAPLSIRLHGDGAQATKLPAYDPSEPIAVTVTDGGTQHLDEVTVRAVGPSGEISQQSLARSADGRFAGSLKLQEPGTWRLRIASRSGALRTETTPVLLTVEAPPPSNAPLVGLAVGASIFVVIGGSGFFLLRRAMAARPTNLEPAA